MAGIIMPSALAFGVVSEERLATYAVGEAVILRCDLVRVDRGRRPYAHQVGGVSVVSRAVSIVAITPREL